MKTYMDFWKDAKYAGLSDTQASNYAKEQIKFQEAKKQKQLKKK